MAFDVKKYYADLGRLFKGGPLVRHRIGNKIAAPGDVGVPIGTARAFLRHVNNAYTSALASYGQYSRLARYSDYNEMESMAEISSALNLYSEEVCSGGETGEIMKVTSANAQIKEALNILFYDVLNIEFNARTWIRNFPVSSKTPIPLLDGRILPIEDLAKEFKSGKQNWVYSVQDKTHKMVPGKVVWCGKNYTTNKLVKATLDDGSVVKTAPEHPFVLRDGTTKRADELKSGDSLMPFYRKISDKSHSIKGYEMVYDPSAGRKYRYTHRIVAHALYPNEWDGGKSVIIHHKDFTKLNNNPENLQPLTQEKHLELHREQCIKILHTPEVTKKRLQSLQKYLRSPERAKKMSDKMKGIYPKYFEIYNNSQLFQEHNKSVRSVSMLFDDNCINYVIKTIKQKNKFISIPKICDILSKNEEFISYFRSINEKFFRLRARKDFGLNNVFSSPTLRKLIESCTNKPYEDFVISNFPHFQNDKNYIKNTRLIKARNLRNHKIKTAEIVDEIDDVYCMTVVGPNGEQDRHNFSVCGINEDGTTNKNSGVFVSNCKYGDQFLLLDHHPDYGVLNVLPMPVNEVEREEGYDPKNPLAYRYRWITQGNRVLENWQVIHFRMLANDNFLPYGSSILEPARRVWRQLILLEDAVMVYRIVRSPERRVFYIGVGNVAPSDIPAFVEKAKTGLKRNQIVDTATGRVDLRYNPMSTDEDYFIPVRGEGDGTRIDTLPGGQFTGDIDDLIYIQNKLFAALKVPKSYLGYEGDINAKSTLSQEDVRFARTIRHIQKIFLSELNKIAVIHLYSMGFKGEDLINFELSMPNPSTISELQQLELWRTKFEVASIAQEGMFDRYFIYSKLFKLSDDEIAGIEEGKRKDKLFDMDLESIVGASIPSEPAVDQSQEAQPAQASPEAGLPPPPGEAGPPEGGLDTAGKDPNKQIGAPNELVKVNQAKKERATMPNLHNYAFNMKKTAMDPKRNHSELTRIVKAPFGEGSEQDVEQTLFDSRVTQLKKFAEDLGKIEILRASSEKKTKKIISG